MDLKLEGLPHQIKFWQDFTLDRRLALVGPLGTGKTRSLLVKDLLMHLANIRQVGRGFTSMLVGPTFGMVADIWEPEIDEVLNQEFRIGVQVRRVNGRPVMVWPRSFKGARTLLRSAEVPSRLTGTNLSHVGYDEPGQMVHDAWKKGGGRARHPRAAFRQRFAVGSPEGNVGWFAHLFDRPKPPHFTIRARHWHPAMAAYPAQLKIDYAHDPAQLDAYLNALFVPMFTGRCYTLFDRLRHSTLNPTLTADYDPALTLQLTCDFNIDSMRWLVIQDHPKEIRVIDEIALGYNGQVGDAAEEFRDRYSIRNGNVVQHRGTVRVTGDATGRARSQTGEDCYSVLMKVLGGNFSEVIKNVPKNNPFQRDRVTSVQYHLGALGKQVVINEERCPELCMDLEHNYWVKGKAEIAKSHEPPESERTHAGDAFGYWIHQNHRPRRVSQTQIPRAGPRVRHKPREDWQHMEL